MTQKANKAAEAAVEAVQEVLIPVETVASADAEKPAKKAPAEKKTAAKTVKKAAEKKESAEKSVKKTASRTATKKGCTATVEIQFGDSKATPDELVARAKEDWAQKGNSLDDVKKLAVYFNATEGMVYYVVNDIYNSGSFRI